MGEDVSQRLIRLEKLVADLRETLSGIDKQETEENGGWWETSTGAEFGERKLWEVIELVSLAFLEK